MCYLEGFYKGIMLVGPAKGSRVEEAKPIIREHMLKENLAIVYYEPEGEVVSRSGD
jgi:leucyl-tRNA synthetase